MKRSEIMSTGVSGINLMLTNVELVALKGFVNQLKGLNPENNKYDYARDAKVLVANAIVFLEKMLPEEVISIEDAYKELFTLPVEPVIEPANNNEL
jgi:hypothetical protein